MSIIDSMEKFLDQNNVPVDIKEAFFLYEKIRTLSLVDEIYEEVRLWVANIYKIHNIKIIISSVNKKDLIFHNGKQYDEEDNLSLNFNINISDESTILFSFLCENEEHFNEVNKKYMYINLLFYTITPLIGKSFSDAKLRESSYKDNITDLYNRTYLMQHLDKMLPLARREQKKVGFLMIGMDHFKAVIDEFDYTIGDKVLVELAKTLLDNTRESDIVVRLEADEFLVVLANVQEEESAIMVAKKLIERFSQCEVDVNSYTGQTLKKTICIGISMYPEDSTSIDQILKNADISLYEARNKGRSQVLRFEKEQESSIDLF